MRTTGDDHEDYRNSPCCPFRSGRCRRACERSRRNFSIEQLDKEGRGGGSTKPTSEGEPTARPLPKPTRLKPSENDHEDHCHRPDCPFGSCRRRCACERCRATSRSSSWIAAAAADTSTKPSISTTSRRLGYTEANNKPSNPSENDHEDHRHRPDCPFGSCRRRCACERCQRLLGPAAGSRRPRRAR